LKYNIALFGTFDVENYGDLMFPEVFTKAMQKRLDNINVVLFSPCGEGKKALDENIKVYASSQIWEIHKKTPFDIVVIGGGALIQYYKIPIKKIDRDEFCDYRILDSWLVPIDFAVRNNVKVAFNLPQVPYEIPDTIAALTCEAVSALSYVSVRDGVSKRFLEDAFYKTGKEAPEINVFPDSVCVMPRLFSLEKVEGLPEKYAVLQFNPQKPENEDDLLFETVKLLKSKRLDVVLLPLGYTHNDDNVLKAFNEKYGNECYMLDRKLNIFEMASVLANSEIYIGSSFHGAITAISYGKGAVSYNYIYPGQKNVEIFKTYGISDYVASNAREVYQKVENFFNTNDFSPKTEEVCESVEKHFDNLAKIIVSEKENKKSDLIGAEFDCFSQSVMDINRLIGYKNEFEIKSALYEQSVKKIKELEETIKVNEQVISSENIELEAIKRSFYWRITSPCRKVGQAIKKVVFKSRILTLICRALKSFLLLGPKTTAQRVKMYLKKKSSFCFDIIKIGNDIKEAQREFESNYKFQKDIKFSVLVPLYNTPFDLLKEMIDSVLCQTYQNFELCLADGSDDEHGYVGEYCKKLSLADKRIVYKKLEKNGGISENTNACIDMSSGDYIALFDHDDLLHSSALFEYMKVICEKGADFIYCDEDKFEKVGKRSFDPFFKPDFAPDNLRANNYICHFTVFSRELLNKVGGFRKEFDGSQDHDLVLRLTEKANCIVHIPKILYHWRVSAVSVASDPYAKPYTITAGINAVSEHLQRAGLKGTVESSAVHPNFYRIRYDIIGAPKISILIPNYNQIEAISRCINSIIEKSTYKNYEIIVIENNSNEQTFKYYETLKKYEQVRVVVYDPNGESFNYSKINNFGAKYADGDYILLLNNDVEIISPNWLEEMLMFAQREEVGAVGAMLYYPNDTIQHAGVILGVGGVAGHSHKYFDRNSCGYFGRLAIQQNLTAVTAACVLIKKSVFDEIGGLDESFQVAFNDIDMCMRIRQKGYLICFTPYAELYHYESISRGSEDTPAKQARFQSEVLRFQERWKNELEAGDPYYNPNLTLVTEDFDIK